MMGDPREDPRRWAVVLDGPSPTGARFMREEDAHKFAAKWNAKGYHALVADLYETIAEMTPKENHEDS